MTAAIRSCCSAVALTSSELVDSFITTCGLPIVNYETELEILLNALAEEEPHVRVSRENIFIGVGNQGRKLVRDVHSSWGDVIKGSEFLMIESSGEPGPLDESSSPPVSSKGDTWRPPMALHLIPRSENTQVGYFGLGERLAIDDPGLDDRLRRSGISSSSEKQTIFLLSALADRRCHGSHRAS